MTFAVYQREGRMLNTQNAAQYIRIYSNVHWVHRTIHLHIFNVKMGIEYIVQYIRIYSNGNTVHSTLSAIHANIQMGIWYITYCKHYKTSAYIQTLVRINVWYRSRIESAKCLGHRCPAGSGCDTYFNWHMCEVVCSMHGEIFTPLQFEAC